MSRFIVLEFITSNTRLVFMGQREQKQPLELSKMNARSTQFGRRDRCMLMLMQPLSRYPYIWYLKLMKMNIKLVYVKRDSYQHMINEVLIITNLTTDVCDILNQLQHRKFSHGTHRQQFKMCVLMEVKIREDKLCRKLKIKRKMKTRVREWLEVRWKAFD